MQYINLSFFPATIEINKSILMYLYACILINVLISDLHVHLHKSSIFNLYRV